MIRCSDKILNTIGMEVEYDLQEE